MSKQTFPVTITGMNITERNVTPPRFKSPIDKAGITIQEVNVTDENGSQLVIPTGTWINGAAKVGSLDNVSVGSTIEVSISAKPKGDGTFWYNFSYYPKLQTTAPAAPTQPVGEYVTVADFQKAISNLQDQINDINNF